ncbi:MULTISPECIES: MFS transporter [Roseomonadaceae]|uniref:MFS transporter n=1 Tax=Falsiroseomonas oleicola TaxID=2801474 RepID=A0ABS6HES6_9PROT|nr:MFS transporter [Roseomonas oleicola]MBU8546463.1 MFS transporter [Roseomonas oleicola]
MLSPWVAALSATLLMQTVGTFLSQAVPVVAPLMTAELGLRPEAVGNFASLNTLGAILFLLFGTPLVARFGPLRMLQAGAVLGSVALLAAAAGIVWLLPLAALLMGIGYGPTGPAGSRILQATAPPRHRVLIFSVKQAGAPAGGALAGLVAAPVAAIWGWQAALLVGIAVALACAVLIQPLRPQLDAERDPQRPLREAFRLRRLAAPITALRMHPVLPPLTLQAFAFAALQGSLFAFTVTWLVQAHGASLTAAGSVFAAMQLAGVAGRLVLGWAADRLGDATRSLAIHGLVAAFLSLLWVLFGPQAHWAVGLVLAVACGFTAASWNGIFLAEVARVSPPDRVAEASSGAILLCFLGYLSAPSAFAWAVTSTGSWVLPYLVACGLLAAVSTFVLMLGGRAGSR